MAEAVCRPNIMQTNRTEEERQERKRRRKSVQGCRAHAETGFCRPKEALTQCGRIVDPVWHALAKELVSDPATAPEIVQVLAESLAIHSVDHGIRIKKRQTPEWFLKLRAEQDAEQAARVQAVLERREQLGVGAWWLCLAEHPADRALVGVRNRPIKITIAENAILPSCRKSRSGNTSTAQR